MAEILLQQFPDIWRQNPDYTYEVSYIRAVEPRLIDKSRLERLIATGDPFELAKALEETDYGVYSYLLENPHEYERAIQEERARVYQLFEILARNSELTYLMRSKFDFHNIKVLLKASLSEENFDFALQSLGNVEPGELKRIFEEERYIVLPDFMQRAIEEGVSAYYEKKNPRDLSMAVDRVFYRYAVQKAGSLEIPFLEAYFCYLIDLKNISTLLRLKYFGLEINKALFLDAGCIPSERFMEMSSQPFDSLAEPFAHTVYHGLVEAGVHYLKETGSFLRFYRLSDNFIVDFIKLTRFIDMGIEPVIGYLLLKEIEFKIVRILFTGKINRVSNKVLREALPQL